MTTNYLQQQLQSQSSWSWEQAAMAPPNHDHHQFQVETEREYMFEKTLTPSDVGKLNRLVIPKQNAEKYFPLINGEQSGENGQLLDFEDDAGKVWRFRYSYWSSSQSYVLTKGWSRFVKDKRLDAGDVVVFQRHRSDNLHYIGCRRRGEAQNITPRVAVPRNAVLPWTPTLYSASQADYYNSTVQQESHAGNQMSGMPESSAATKPVNSRQLRLFGVTLDCGPEL